MRDRVPTKPNRYAVYDDNHNFVRYEYHERADEPTEAGTPLNKANLLSDTTAAAIESAFNTTLPSDPSINDALSAIGTLSLDVVQLLDATPVAVETATAWSQTFELSESLANFAFYLVFAEGLTCDRAASPIVHLCFGPDNTGASMGPTTYLNANNYSTCTNVWIFGGLVPHSTPYSFWDGINVYIFDTGTLTKRFLTTIDNISTATTLSDNNVTFYTASTSGGVASEGSIRIFGIGRI